MLLLQSGLGTVRALPTRGGPGARREIPSFPVFVSAWLTAWYLCLSVLGHDQKVRRSWVTGGGSESGIPCFLSDSMPPGDSMELGFG